MQRYLLVYMIRVSLLCMFLVVSMKGSSAMAYEGNASDYAVDIGTKLSRGVWNVLSSPAELPCTIKAEVSSEGGSGAWTGIGRGSWRMFRRILVGATEIMTFVIPMDRTIPPVCREEKEPHIGVA